MPMLYYANAEMDMDGSVQVTGSHNPADHNGFKLVMQHRPFFRDGLAVLGPQASADDWIRGAADSIDWDAGNRAAGPVVEKLVKLIPAEHHLLFADIDRHFPHHHSDPADDTTLADLKTSVIEKTLDFGVAFNGNGDGDRIGVVDGLGMDNLWADRLLAILAEPVLKSQPGVAIIADVKAGQMVFDQIAALGGQVILTPSGHSLMKSKMVQTGSPLAAEMNFGLHDYHGVDHALHAAVRLIRVTMPLGKTVT